MGASTCDSWAVSLTLYTPVLLELVLMGAKVINYMRGKDEASLTSRMRVPPIVHVEKYVWLARIR